MTTQPDVCDWSAFYTALCRESGRLLDGIDDETREVISLVSETDSFWSDGLQPTLADGAVQGDIRSGVLATLDLWRENVLSVLSGDFSMDLDRSAVTIDAGNPAIDILVAAATPA